MDTVDFISNMLVAGLRAGIPLLIAALGEIMCERSGVLNLGVEGMMLMGAMTGFAVGRATGNPWLGIAAALFAGGGMGLLHGFVTITLRSNQTISGLALTLLGAGLSGFLGPSLVGTRGVQFYPLHIPVLSDLPFLGPVLFRHNVLVYLGLMLVPTTWIWLFKTRPGLHMRLVGENPTAADVAGINVWAQRYIYVVVGGVFAGAAGAYISLAYTPGWKELMIAGRGWIAVALVIFAMWNPLRAALGAFLFGAVSALQFGVQIQGVDISIFFLQMMPYLFTLIVLGVASRDVVRKRIAVPAALGIPYDREQGEV